MQINISIGIDRKAGVIFAGDFLLIYGCISYRGDVASEKYVDITSAEPHAH